MRSNVWGYSLGEILIGVVVIAACIALVLIALNYFKITLPEWVKQVFWVVAVTFVVVLAIRFLMTL